MSSDERIDPTQSDPFFTLPKSSEWNACIGRQSCEENYVDGYIEAALELVDALIEKGMYIKRDTLVMPILYNARHAIELTLKFLINRLTERKVLTAPHRQNHDILSHIKYLTDAAPPDESLRTYLARLYPFVLSLSNIDEDGQELRYYKNRSGDCSLDGYSLANIKVIRSSLQRLFVIIHDLKIRTFEFCTELAWGTNTNRLSRRDLLEIAKLLPDRSKWKDETFSTVASNIKDRYSLSNNQFSIALNSIQNNRLMKARIGLETPLVHLRRENAIFIAECWLQIHPLRDEAREQARDRIITGATLWERLKDAPSNAAIYHAVLKRHSAAEIADAESLFYLARDGKFPERYEILVKNTEVEHRASDNLQGEISHILDKTNFLAEFAKGVMLVGSLELAKELEGLVARPS